MKIKIDKNLDKNIANYLKIIDRFFAGRSYCNLNCLEFRDDLIEKEDIGKRKIIDLYTKCSRFRIFIYSTEATFFVYQIIDRKGHQFEGEFCCVGDIPYNLPLTEEGWYKLLGKMMEYEMDDEKSLKNIVNEERGPNQEEIDNVKSIMKELKKFAKTPEEIDNVKSIMEDLKKFVKIPEDKKKLDEIIKGFIEVSEGDL